MPRTAFALPFLPHMQEQWHATAAEIPGRHASGYRMQLLDRGVYRERWWMQTGEGSPPLTLVLWDCDDIDRAVVHPEGAPTPFETWMAREVLQRIHGLDPTTFVIPRAELLSGTTTMATATAGTQTMFALPLPAEAVEPVRALIGRIEHGDLAQTHGRFLADASIREEWIWLQMPQPGCPALLLVHWIGDDLDAAWHRLTHVRGDEYARVMHEALFTRLVGIPPERVAAWEVEQLLVMHVRRSDAQRDPLRTVARRLLGGLLRASSEAVAAQMAEGARLHPLDGGDAVTGEEVVRHLTALMSGPDGSMATIGDVLVGDDHVVVLLHHDGTTDALPVMLRARGRLVEEIRVLPPVPRG